MQWQLFGWRTKFLRCMALYGLGPGVAVPLRIGDPVRRVQNRPPDTLRAAQDCP